MEEMSWNMAEMMKKMAQQNMAMKESQKKKVVVKVMFGLAVCDFVI